MSIEISIIANDLEDGELFRGVCPYCHGGNTKEISFSLKREANVAHYKCFRASCNAGGRFVYKGNLVYPNRQQGVLDQDIHALRYKEPILPLSEDAYAFLARKYNLARMLLRQYSLGSTTDSRVVLPMRDRNGRVTGEELKAYEELTHTKGLLKSLVFADRGVPLLAWYKGSYSYIVGEPDSKQSTDTLLVVEDQISAMKASVFCHSVALLGTTITTQKILEIAADSYKSVLFAFDSDAFKAAVGAYRKAHALIQGLRIVRLSKDIKDSKYEEIKQIVKP